MQIQSLPHLQFIARSAQSTINMINEFKKVCDRQNEPQLFEQIKKDYQYDVAVEVAIQANFELDKINNKTNA